MEHRDVEYRPDLSKACLMDFKVVADLLKIPSHHGLKMIDFWRFKLNGEPFAWKKNDISIPRPSLN